jgi:hypothetical protein
MTRPSLLSTFCAVFRKPRDPQGRPLSYLWNDVAYDRLSYSSAILMPFLPAALCALIGAGLTQNIVVNGAMPPNSSIEEWTFLAAILCWPASWFAVSLVRAFMADRQHPRFETAPSYLERFRIRGGPERERAFNNGLSMFVWLSRKLDDDMSELREALIDVQEAGMRWREDSYRLPEAQEARGHFALVTLAEYADRMYRDENLRASPAARGDLKQAAEATRTLLDSILTGRETVEVSDFTSGVRALSNQIGAGPALDRRTREHGHA